MVASFHGPGPENGLGLGSWASISRGGDDFDQTRIERPVPCQEKVTDVGLVKEKCTSLSSSTGVEGAGGGDASTCMNRSARSRQPEASASASAPALQAIRLGFIRTVRAGAGNGPRAR